jgi:hypothetical protein
VRRRRLGRLFDCTLRLYARSFRERFGEEMRALFDDLLEEAGGSRAGGAAVAIRAFVALPGGVFAAWRRNRRADGRQRETFLSTASLVCALALVACLVPAVKASGQDPLASLRAER